MQSRLAIEEILIETNVTTTFLKIESFGVIVTEGASLVADITDTGIMPREVIIDRTGTFKIQPIMRTFISYIGRKL